MTFNEDRCVGPHALRGGPCILVDCPDCAPECRRGNVLYRGDRGNMCGRCPTCYGTGKIRRYRLSEIKAIDQYHWRKSHA